MLFRLPLLLLCSRFSASAAHIRGKISIIKLAELIFQILLVPLLRVIGGDSLLCIGLSLLGNVLAESRCTNVLQRVFIDEFG